MNLSLKKQKLKNLSPANSLPSAATPFVGGGITAAAGCPATTTQESVVCHTQNCSQDIVCASFGGTCGGCLSDSDWTKWTQLTC